MSNKLKKVLEQEMKDKENDIKNFIDETIDEIINDSVDVSAKFDNVISNMEHFFRHIYMIINVTKDIDIVEDEEIFEEITTKVNKHYKDIIKNKLDEIDPYYFEEKLKEKITDEDDSEDSEDSDIEDSEDSDIEDEDGEYKVDEGCESDESDK